MKPSIRKGLRQANYSRAIPHVQLAYMIGYLRGGCDTTAMVKLGEAKFTA